MQETTGLTFFSILSEGSRSHFSLWNISQPSYLPRKCWKNLHTAFIISTSPFSKPSPLWQCFSFRVLFVCGGCWGRERRMGQRRLFSHQSNWCDYTRSHGKGCNLSKQSWGGSKLSISLRYYSIPGFLSVFQRKAGHQEWTEQSGWETWGLMCFSESQWELSALLFFFIKPLAFVFYLNSSVSVPPSAVIRKMDNAEYANYARMLWVKLSRRQENWW